MIDWDTYFLTICFLISQKSRDKFTKHGALIVDKKHRIISTGFNWAPSGIDDSKIPEYREARRGFMVHSEQNCLLFAKQDVSECTLYCTGKCCSGCMKEIAQAGIKRIVYGKVKSKMVDKADISISDFLIKECGIEVVELNSGGVLSLLDSTISYVKERAI